MKFAIWQKKYDALVMVDDSHAAGFIGKTGRGTGEYHGVMDRIDILTGTLGKALGGAMGGYTTGKEIIEMLRQRSRPYLFSNSLSPGYLWSFIAVFDMLSASTGITRPGNGKCRIFPQQTDRSRF